MMTTIDTPALHGASTRSPKREASLSAICRDQRGDRVTEFIQDRWLDQTEVESVAHRPDHRHDSFLLRIEWPVATIALAASHIPGKGCKANSDPVFPKTVLGAAGSCLLYTSPSPRDGL